MCQEYIHICTHICTGYNRVHITYAQCICDMHRLVSACIALYLYVSSAHRSCIQCICACMSGIFSRHTCRYMHICIPEGSAYLYVCDCIFLLHTYRYARAYLYVCTCISVCISVQHTCFIQRQSLRACCALAVRSPRGICTFAALSLLFCQWSPRGRCTFAAHAHAQAVRQFHSDQLDSGSWLQQACLRCALKSELVPWHWLVASGPRVNSRRGAQERR